MDLKHVLDARGGEMNSDRISDHNLHLDYRLHVDRGCLQSWWSIHFVPHLASRK